MGNDVEVVRRAPRARCRDVPALREGLRRRATEASRRRWTLAIRREPGRGGRRGPVIWMAREPGRLLGQKAAMRVSLWCGGREVRASWGKDVFVRADATGRGRGRAPLHRLERPRGGGARARPHAVVLRAVQEAPLPRRGARAVLPEGPGRARGRAAAAGSGPGHAGGPVLSPRPGAALRLGPRGPRRGRRGATTPAFCAEFDALWERARASYAMCVRRDDATSTGSTRPVRTAATSCARRGARGRSWASRSAATRTTGAAAGLDRRRLRGHRATTRRRTRCSRAVLASFRAAGVARAQAFA